MLNARRSASIVFCLGGLLLVGISGGYSCGTHIVPITVESFPEKGIEKEHLLIEPQRQEQKTEKTTQEKSISTEEPDSTDSFEPSLEKAEQSDAAEDIVEEASPEEHHNEHEGQPEQADDTSCKVGSQRYCYPGPKGTAGVGECRKGVQVCNTPGVWGPCIYAVVPKKEVCNRKDDDCNGQVDDACVCKPGSKRSCKGGLGTCAKGEQTCGSAGFFWGPCISQTPPSKEICDNKDNDCDGKTDEDVQRTCYTGPPNTQGKGECRSGIATCQQGKWSACTKQTHPTTEVCDGKDNDCNGKIDDNWSEIGQPCKIGTNNCLVIGKWACSKDQKNMTCLGNIPKPTPEVCDGRDNDCDGKVDERKCYPTGTKGCTQVNGKWVCQGTCQVGVQYCVGTKWTSCKSSVVPTAQETCHDKKDNDCDGKIDEDCCQKSTFKVLWGHNATGSIKWQDDLTPVVSPDLNYFVLKGRLYSLKTGQMLKLLTASYLTWAAGSFSPDSKQVAISTGKTLKIYSVPSGKWLRSFSISISTGNIAIATYHFDGRHLSALIRTGSGYTYILTWRLSDGKQLKPIKIASAFIIKMMISKDGKWAAISQNSPEEIKIYRILDGKLVHSIKFSFRPYFFDIHPNNLTLVGWLPTDETSYIREIKTGKELTKFKLDKQHLGTPTEVRFSPNGRWLATRLGSSWPGISIRDTKSYKEIVVGKPSKKLKCRRGKLQWSLDSKTVVLACKDTAMAITCQ